MNITEENTIAATVIHDYRTAMVFQKYGIDFCCKGSVTIKESCSKNRIDQALLLNEISKLSLCDSDSSDDFYKWPLDKLAEYIEQKHHHYVEERTPLILQFLTKICTEHGLRHPELFEIKNQFDLVAANLGLHMRKEEILLFPYIKKMMKAKINKTKCPQATFGSIKNPVNMMMSEHTFESDRIDNLSKLSNNYTTPADGCVTYSITFQMLKDYAEDLHKHIHLENDILFPKSIELENSFTL